MDLIFCDKYAEIGHYVFSPGQLVVCLTVRTIYIAGKSRLACVVDWLLTLAWQVGHVLPRLMLVDDLENVNFDLFKITDHGRVSQYCCRWQLNKALMRFRDFL